MFIYMCRSLAITIIAFYLLLFTSQVSAFVPSEQYSDIHYKDLLIDEQGYLSNTSNDAFIVFKNIDLNRAQMCGMVMAFEFKNIPERAVIFDLYWRSKGTGFSEDQKGFFIINQADAKHKNTYAIPLCKLHGFSGNLHASQLQKNIISLRLDYPPNKNLAIRFDSMRLLNSTELQKTNNVILLEPYERVSRYPFTSLDVVIPKFIFAFEHGLKRLSQDISFLIFWLLLILFFKVLIIRSFIRQSRNDN